MIALGNCPEKDEFELTLFGPGYGESMVLHVGGGDWIIVDSCLDIDKTPSALRYLNDIGADPARTVKLIVATHWHDDHVRGMAQLVESCGQAKFCCAAALCKKEFLVAMDALNSESDFFDAVSGMQELHGVYERLRRTKSPPIPAVADRLIFNHSGCQIWSLSPSDRVFQKFLLTIGGFMPKTGETRQRVPDLSPNEAAVVLWIKVNDIAVLLDSDLERQGWMNILRNWNSGEYKASAFKIPHHGSKDSDVRAVWTQMLEPNSFAVLAPWRRGGNNLPSFQDIMRILSNTENAYASAKLSNENRPLVHRNNSVEEITQNSGAVRRRTMTPFGAIRLRRCIKISSPWHVELLGTACHLREFS